MRIAYLDSSALVKAYTLEAGTDRVKAVIKSATMENPTVLAVVCDIARVEVASAIARKEFEGSVAPGLAERLRAQLEQHFTKDPKPYLIVHASSVLADAATYARTYRLKSMDAIQLAAALAAKYLAPFGAEFEFYCADGKLCAAARAENFNVIQLPTAVAAGGA